MGEMILHKESRPAPLIQITDILDVTNYKEGLKAIIFDLDDTLYGEKAYVRSGYHKIAELFPQVKDAEYKLWRLFEEGKPAIDEFLKSEGLFTDENKERCLNAYRLQKPDIHLYPGIKGMLLQLRRTFKLGLITDGRPEGQNAKIDALGIRDLFNEIIITDELGGIEYRKPNDIAFRIMAHRLDIEFSDMCYVGDNVQKDFIASESLGMRSIWFKNPEGLY